MAEFYGGSNAGRGGGKGPSGPRGGGKAGGGKVSWAYVQKMKERRRRREAALEDVPF